MTRECEEKRKEKRREKRKEERRGEKRFTVFMCVSE
jgi:hypothetical protein